MHTRSFVGASVLVLAALGCRDDNESPTEPTQIQPTALATSALSFRQVSGGTSHTCGVTADGRSYCWGFGAIGNGTDASLRPALVAGNLRFLQVSSGNGFSCGVTTQYRAYCWGFNNQGGQQGDGTTAPHRTPVPVQGGHQFRQVAAGSFHTCGVSYPDGQVYCWGWNFSAQLGDRTTTARLTPTPVASTLPFRQVTAGWEHTCGVTTGNRAYCWGNNRYGQVGDSTNVRRRYRPVPVAGWRKFKEISAGYQHTCAVTPWGRAFCWGDGRNGQIGNGKAYLSFWPRRVAGDLYFDRIGTGHWHSCGVVSQNRAYCWGANFIYQLGDGTFTNRLVPVAVAGGLEFSQVSGGGEHTCGVSPTNVAYCWGYNSDGELGDGTTEARPSPTPVTSP